MFRQSIHYDCSKKEQTTLYIRLNMNNNGSLGSGPLSVCPRPPPPLGLVDAQCTMDCLRDCARFQTVVIQGVVLFRDPAVLNLFYDSLPLCTSLTTMNLARSHLQNDQLQRLLPALTNIKSLNISRNHILGLPGGDALRALLFGNRTLEELDLSNNPFGRDGGIAGLGQGLAKYSWLQKLNLECCNIDKKMSKLNMLETVTENSWLSAPQLA
jgi:Leucine Rich repeat